MSDDYYIFHPHNTPEENPRVRYHIISGDTAENKTLCGVDTTKKLRNYSSNGDTITLKWYNQNIAVTDGIVCRKCAKKIEKILKKEI